MAVRVPTANLNRLETRVIAGGATRVRTRPWPRRTTCHKRTLRRFCACVTARGRGSRRRRGSRCRTRLSCSSSSSPPRASRPLQRAPMHVFFLCVWCFLNEWKMGGWCGIVRADGCVCLALAGRTRRRRRTGARRSPRKTSSARWKSSIWRRVWGRHFAPSLMVRGQASRVWGRVGGSGDCATSSSSSSSPVSSSSVPVCGEGEALRCGGQSSGGRKRPRRRDSGRG